MRIRVILPVSHDLLNHDAAEECALYAAAGTEISVVSLDAGPRSVEGEYEEAMAIPGILRRAQEAEQDGCDAIISDCFGDPGVKAARELVDVPVIGPAEASFLLAASLGHRFSVITVLDSVVPMIENLIQVAGLSDRLASVRTISIPVLSLEDRVATRNALWEEMLAAIKNDHAHVLILGCTGMTGAAEGLQQDLFDAGYMVPVISPVGAAVKLAESLVSLRLKQSRLTYARPKDCNIELRPSSTLEKIA